jgi:hypothetical protein
MPSLPLPEITLPAPAALPPMVFGEPRKSSCRCQFLSGETRGVGPIQLPATTFGVA